MTKRPKPTSGFAFRGKPKIRKAETGCGVLITIGVVIVVVIMIMLRVCAAGPW